MNCNPHLSFFICILILLPIINQASNSIDDNLTLFPQQEVRKLVYRKANSYGFQLHSNGVGISVDFINTRNYFKRKFLRFDLINIKHPKQYRDSSFSANFLNNRKPYAYGKINSFYALNASRGLMSLIADKGRKNGIELSWLYSYGISLGIAKPYYLASCNENCTSPIYLKYSEETANVFLDEKDPNISKAPGRLGWTEVKLYPGVQAKVGFNVDFAIYADVVQAVEFGIMLNAYLKRVPIMLTNSNHFIYPNLYIKASLGKRIY